MDASEAKGNVGRVKGCWLTVTRACNLRCKWCYAVEGRSDVRQDMPSDLAHQLIDVVAELGARSVVFIGGEPTLYPCLTDVSRYAGDLGITPMVVTNGIRFSNRKFCGQIVEAGIKKVTISIKGSSEDQYIGLTRSRGFARMLMGAANLRSFGVEPSFEITIAKGFLADIDVILATLGDYGVSCLTVDLASPVIIGDRPNVPGVPSPFELRDAVHRVYRSGISSTMDYVIYMTIPFCLLDSDVLHGLKEQDRLVSSCHVSRGDALVFDERGRILPCNHLGSHTLGQWGVDFSSSHELTEFWNSAEVVNFRSVCGCYPAGPCQACPEWNECGGGCMIKWLYWNPADFIAGFEGSRKEA